MGGDKVGGSFKFCLQVVNRDSPNSANHTVVLLMLEADDSLTNMHIAMDPFKDFIEELHMWLSYFIPILTGKILMVVAHAFANNFKGISVTIKCCLSGILQ